MIKLKGFQKKYLKGLAHGLSPVVQVGKNGLTDSLFKQINDQLEIHELIQIKFTDHKDEKKELTQNIETGTDSILIGIIGHIAIFYKENAIEDKRKIEIPETRTS